MSDNHAREILQLAEFVQTLAKAVKSASDGAIECGRITAQLTEQMHVAQRRLRMLEHAAGIAKPFSIPSDGEEEFPRSIQ